MKTIVFPLFLLSLVLPFNLKGQTNKDKSLKFYLNEDSTHYFKTTFLNQAWVRFNESNPGTTQDGVVAPSTFDLGLRRTRIQMFGQVTDRTFIYMQFGQNNFNAMHQVNGNRKIAAFFHDALCEYKVTKGNELKIGSGMTIANGLSRFTQPSIGTILSLDVPVFAQATVEQIDQFGRKLSLYARGQLGKLDYRLALTDPFPIGSRGSTPPTIEENAQFAEIGRKKQLQAYLSWNFKDKEGHTTPYMPGTYLGKKDVMNVAFGVIYQPEAMWYLQNGVDTAYTDMLLMCAEFFMDKPMKNDGVLSYYLGAFRYDYGPNFLRYNGIMNPANGTVANTAMQNVGKVYGNTFPMFGTGNVMYTQLGYKLPKALKCGGFLQPYATMMYAQYERLDGEPMMQFDLGVNWLIDGHKSKLSFDWQNRPTYYLDNSVVKSGSRRNAFILQYQIYI